MLTFYLIAGGLAVLAAGVLVRPLIAGRAAADSRDAHDARVFRDQLAEIERDLARGTISPDEAEGAHAEVSRRLLAATERAQRGDAPRPAPRVHSGIVAGLALIGTPAMAALVYVGLGAPGVPDQPLASRHEEIAFGGSAARPGQEEAEAAMAGRQAQQGTPDPQYAAMVDQLETVLASRPDEIQGRKLLANALMNLGRYGEAWRAYDRVVELSGGAADAEMHASQAEGMILAAGGYVSPEAEAEIARALRLDPSLPIARYYGGVALRQAGRLDEAIAIWDRLRRESAPDAPWLDWLDRMLAEARQVRGGGAPGPGPEEIAAANAVRSQTARLGLAPGDGPAADAAGDSAAQQPAGTAAQTTEAPAVAPAVPQPAPAPTQADMAAAARMAPADRAAMIEGMVARLESRLSGEGGSAEEWLRLIDGYVKLERPDEAARAYRLAAEALTGDPQAGFVREQALLMGVAVE